MNKVTPVDPPLAMLAELTHRCPLRCPYCSNPLDLDARSSEMSTDEWFSVFDAAAALGVVHVHLSGGEPAARRDLIALAKRCSTLGLYTNLITSGVGLTPDSVQQLAEAGLDHVQLSIQDKDQQVADRIAGYPGAFQRKQEIAAWVTHAGLPLTVNAVIHRANIERVSGIVRMAVDLGARRVEVAHTQYYGWALPNRAALMPTREQTDRALAEVAALRVELDGVIVIDQVVPDYYATYPKACMGGWARRSLNITPSGKALPCHAAETIPGLEFWSVRDHSLEDIWLRSPAFTAFRGYDWMQEPCRSCYRREIDFGGCRCQAMALAGEAAATDPACHRSPLHSSLLNVATAASSGETIPDYVYRSHQHVAHATEAERVTRLTTNSNSAARG